MKKPTKARYLRMEIGSIPPSATSGIMQATECQRSNYQVEYKYTNEYNGGQNQQSQYHPPVLRAPGTALELEETAYGQLYGLGKSKGFYKIHIISF